MFVLGFDPGGKNQFGWCVAESTPSALSLVRSGVADDAWAAVSSALQHVSQDVCGAGIDSPLFWAVNGKRRADLLIREEMKRYGAANVGGTVQDANSLRGACIVQGILTAHLLRDRFSNIRITESHPKALLWLLKIANKRRRVVDVRMSHLSKVIACETDSLSDHERDAALGAFAAWAMVNGLEGWRNLFHEDDGPYVPVAGVEYWMPISGK
jgi:hypothetical protein